MVGKGKYGYITAFVKGGVSYYLAVTKLMHPKNNLVNNILSNLIIQLGIRLNMKIGFLEPYNQIYYKLNDNVYTLL